MKLQAVCGLLVLSLFRSRGSQDPDAVVPEGLELEDLEGDFDTDWIQPPTRPVPLADEDVPPYIFRYTQLPPNAFYAAAVHVDRMLEPRAAGFPGAQKVFLCADSKNSSVTLYEQWRSKGDRQTYVKWFVANTLRFEARGESINNHLVPTCDAACLAALGHKQQEVLISEIPKWVYERCEHIKPNHAPFQVAKTSKFFVQQVLPAYPGKYDELLKEVLKLEPRKAGFPGAESVFICEDPGVRVVTYEIWNSSAAFDLYNQDCLKQGHINRPLIMGAVVNVVSNQIPEWVLSKCRAVTADRVLHASITSPGGKMDGPPLAPLRNSPYFVEMTQPARSDQYNSLVHSNRDHLRETAARPGAIQIWQCNRGKIIQVFEKWRHKKDQEAYVIWRLGREKKTQAATSLSASLSQAITMQDIENLPPSLHNDSQCELVK